MLNKNAFAILSLFCLIANPASAMKEQKPNNSIVKTVLVTLNEDPVETIKSKYRFVLIPQSQQLLNKKNRLIT